MAIARTRSREIQLFDPPADAVYTIEATSHQVNVCSGAYGVRYLFVVSGFSLVETENLRGRFLLGRAPKPEHLEPF